MSNLTANEYARLGAYLREYLDDQQRFIDNGTFCTGAYYREAQANLDKDTQDIQNLLIKLNPDT